MLSAWIPHHRDTKTHMLDTCPCVQYRNTAGVIWRTTSRSINNTFRGFTQPTPIHTHDIDLYDQLLTSVDIEELDGWENATTTDKHGRSRITAQGEPVYSVLGQQFS
jgi:hypothetical protein